MLSFAAHFYADSEHGEGETVQRVGLSAKPGHPSVGKSVRSARSPLPYATLTRGVCTVAIGRAGRIARHCHRSQVSRRPLRAHRDADVGRLCEWTCVEPSSDELTCPTASAM